MWRLFLSGLLCVPALVLLVVAPLHDGASRVEHALAANPAAVDRAGSWPIAISLPPSQLLVASFPIEPEPWVFPSTDPVPTVIMQGSPPPRQKPRAKAIVRRDAVPALVARASTEQRQEAVWASLGRWLAQHEAPKTWIASSGGGSG